MATVAKLNAKEQQVFDSIKENGDKIDIEGIAADCWKSKGTGAQTKGNSHVRNSLRKLLRFGLVKKVGRGTYEATGKKLEDVRVKAKPEKTAKAPKAEKKAKTAKTAKPKAAAKAKPVKKAAPKKASKPKAAKKAATESKSNGVVAPATTEAPTAATPSTTV